MIGLEHYAKIKNNYCICYFGYCDEYLYQLKLVRPFLESEFPGLNIYIGCKDERVGYLEGCNNILKLSEIKIRKPEFAHIRELTFDGQTHPIEKLLEEAQISSYTIHNTPQTEPTVKCSILTKSNFPTKNLTIEQILKIKKFAIQNGFEPEVDGTVENAGVVIGVECYHLFKAATQGIKTTLVSTGYGERLFKKMFPFCEIKSV